MNWTFHAYTYKVSNEGNPPYPPAMMVKVLFNSYTKGIFSSRKIVEALKHNVGYIFLAAWQKPDFRTISDFRKNNLKELRLLFAQIALLCRQLGMVKLGHVSIDGTKIKANASDAKTYDSRLIEREIARWLDQVQDTNQKEDDRLGPDNTGSEIPEEIRNQKQRLQRLKELKKKLEQSDGEKVNMTDLDAMFMKTKAGIKTAYNSQAVVDSAQQRGKPVGDFHKDSFVYEEQLDCYLCVEGEKLIFSHLQQRKGKQPLRIYRAATANNASFSAFEPAVKPDEAYRVIPMK